jgi:uncharacterized protein (TIGR00251 family)
MVNRREDYNDGEMGNEAKHPEGPPIDGNKLEITEIKDGCRLKVRVKPGGKKDAILGIYGGALKISVTAPPERGKANAGVIKLLSKRLDISRDQMVITSGEGSRNKSLSIAGLAPEEVRSRLTDS